MASIELPQDFREFLKLLNEYGAKYLLIGGYAVGYHGYPRATADLDIWIAINQKNSEKLVDVFKDFGLKSADVTRDLFLLPGNIVRIGVPPVRIEVLNEIDGVSFSECIANAVYDDISGVPVPFISLADLRRNKLASGRHKDLDDLEHLPE